MRCFLMAGAVLGLSLSLAHVGISRTAQKNLDSLRSAAVPAARPNGKAAIAQILPSAQPARQPQLADSSSWIGGRDHVVLNRSWQLISDWDPRVGPGIVLAAAREARPAPRNSGSSADLAEQVRAYKGTFRPIAPAELAAAQADLKAKVDRLGWLLSGSGADVQAANDAWKSALHWDELQTAVSQGSAAKPDELRNLANVIRDAQSSETLDPHEEESAGTRLGFRTALDDVGMALHRFRLLLAAAGPDGQRQFDERLDALAKALGSNPETWNSTEAVNVGRWLGDMQVEGQVPELVKEIHERFSQPNLVIRAPKEFIAKLTQQDPVDETNKDFRDTILGTSIFGTTHIQGQKTVALVPNDRQAVMAVTFTGAVASQTVGYHPPVTVTSHSTTALQGTVWVTINGDGFTSSQACSQACTHTCIDCIAVCGGRLVQRIAPKRVYKSKPEAECVAGQHAEQRLNERIESDAVESLGKSNRNYKAKLRDPLMSWGAFPQIRYSSTANELMVHALEANSFQLAAPITVSSPAFDGNPFLAVRLHQTFVNNLLSLSLGGRTVSQAQFEDSVGNMLGPDVAAKTRKSGESSKEIREREAKMTDAQREQFEKDLKFKRASRKITFAESDPVTVDFSDHAFSITIRGTHFEGEDLDRPAGAQNITAHYNIVAGPNGAQRAVRTGELEVAPPSWRKLTPLQRTTLKTAEVDKIRGRFNDLLPPTIEFQGLDFSNSAPPWNKIGSLQAYQVSSGNGWLAIDWREAAQ